MRPQPKRYLQLILLPTLALTISSFVASTWIAMMRARGIGDAATSIATNALPSIDLLSDMRTRLRHLSVRLDDDVDRSPRYLSAADRAGDSLKELEAVEEDWSHYINLEVYPGERGLQPRVTVAIGDVRTSAEALMAALRRRDHAAAEMQLETHLKPAVDRADTGLVEIMRVNTHGAVRLSRRIVRLRESARTSAALLDIVSAALSLVVGLVAIRLVLRYSLLMQGRIADLSDFAGRVAHDIRGPLGSVSLALELAQRDTETGQKTQDMLGRATRTVQRVGQIVDGLLVFAVAGAPPPGGSKADVKKVIDDVVEGYLPAAVEKGVTLRAEQSAPLVVACSPGVLASLVSNLVGNAIKYMGDAPAREVTVEAHPLGRSARIEVADTGPGVPPELQPHIFSPYVRAAQAGIPGMGLGLATVRRLVEAHGGVVGVTSRAGGGSVFWMELPLARTR